MSNERTESNNQLDPMDGLLSNAFEQALADPNQQTLVDQVMARIARQQRQRALVLALFGLIALAIGMLSVMPLLELIPSFFSSLPGLPAAETELQFSLPVIAAAVAMAAAGGWLLLEEATA